jgi:hypothetical protein
MDTVSCGDLWIEVAAGGELALHRSTLSTVSKVPVGQTCPQGYKLAVSGKLTLLDSKLDYMSGTYSKSFLPGSSAEIRNSSIAHGDGFCLNLQDPDPGKFVFEGSAFSVQQGRAVIISGKGQGSGRLVFRGCRFVADNGPMNNLAQNVPVDLVDCIFGSRDRIGFGISSGGSPLRIRWTLPVRVMTLSAGVKSPASGLEIVAVDNPRGEPAEAACVTGPDGTALLTLTEHSALEGTGGNIEKRSSHSLRIVRGGKTVAERTVELHGRGRPEELFEIAD